MRNGGGLDRLRVAGDATDHEVVRLSQSRTTLLGSSGDVAAARAAFERDHILRLKALLDPGLVAALPVGVEAADYVDNVHTGIKTELSMAPNASLGLLMLAANDPVFITRVAEITGVDARSFLGRVYRMVPAQGHHDAWHTDCVDDRVLALSVNLSASPYDGGQLHIRDRDTGDPLVEAANVGAGDALLFRVHPSLEHRVGDVVGAHPKTAFAGWFRSSVGFAAMLRDTQLPG